MLKDIDPAIFTREIENLKARANFEKESIVAMACAEAARALADIEFRLAALIRFATKNGSPM